ncbi:suppressor of fused domain protein [Thiobacillus sp.]
MTANRAFVFQRIRQHIEQFWPNREIGIFTWASGPIEDTVPGFVVLRVAPAIQTDPWVYVSMGAWQIEVPGGERMEFFLISPHESPRHVETLAMLAHFHADPRYRLHIGKVIDIGQSWIDDSNLHNLLVSLPYPYGPPLEWCDVGAGIMVRFCWLLPVTETEAAFALETGVERLESKFDEAGIDYLNPARQAVV